MVNGWKVTAWIFIILFVAETALICYAYNLGTDTQENRLKCSNEICFNIKAASFNYDEYSNTCSCNNENEEVIYQEIMK